MEIATWVRTYLAEEREQLGLSQPVTFDRSDLRIVRLVLWRGAGDRVDIQLLRPAQWIEEQNVAVGGILCLNMPEMGVRGDTEVVAIDAAPRLFSDAGRLVTGTFRHTSGEVYDLKLSAESKPIGVTSKHPFWSCDRHAWVSAIDLRIGERVKTLTGTAIVERMSKRLVPEPVYNIEVEGDHVYRVGESGVLVHNQSAGEEKGGQQRQANNPSDPEVTATFSMRGRTFSDVNATARSPRASGSTISGVRPANADQLTMQSEIGAMFEAYQQGLRGGHATLRISGLVACLYCKGDIKTMARALELCSLTIHDADGQVVEFGSPKDLLPVAQGGKGWT